MAMGRKMKRFDFQKDKHLYSFYFDDVKEFINHLVDVADSGKTNLDLVDVFGITRELAKRQAMTK